jgi:stage III sporulation protein AF
MIAAAALTAAPEGSVKKVVRLACGFLIAVALLSPAAGFDYTRFARDISALRAEADGLADGMKETNDRLTALIIEQECAAYIVDKSARLGIDGLKAEVSAEWSVDGYWYPTEARLYARASVSQREEISRYVESELGISPERVIWTQ